jgi:uncharacterized membrane protein
MSQPSSKLQRILESPAEPFRLGDYISQGFQFMNRNFGMLLGFMLVSLVIGFFAQVIPFIGFFLSIIIGPVLQIGYSQFTYAAERENRIDFSEFFKGFNKVGPLVFTYLLTAIVTLVALLPGAVICYQAGVVEWFTEVMQDYPFMENAPDIFETVDMSLLWLGTLAVVVGALLVGTLFAWALNIVWFYDVTPVEALDASRKLIYRNWGSFMVFLIVAGLIGAAGVLLCGVGILYTAPAMAVAQFYAFADATKLLDKDDEDKDPDLIQHFVA